MFRMESMQALTMGEKLC